ncbi:hypothetical protein [uncultured Prevotella sp.]|jgi:uncharacterized protein YcfJ|uniref:hypothetical protein n=1 Tax=uncultured Prevotella sp. TaxID=159272 RepID=UPI0025DB7531|nr:hypothetical protein [uncultured Prevotella sp.]
MKKSFIWVLGLLLVVSACTSNAAGGAYVGGQFGHVIGSAIGGIAGGWRGHHTGALIGTVGGVVAGAAIGAAIDNAQEKKYEERSRARENERYQSDDSGFDPEGRGDDRIMIEPEEAPLNIRNAMITEMQHDGVLTRGEECTVMFEIMNTSDHPIYDIQPFVEDATGNKHINISPNLRVESIGPRQGIRYTATILADKRLKDGEILVRIGVVQAGREVKSQTREFSVPTAKNAR